LLSNDLLAYKTNNLSKGVNLAEKHKFVVFSIGGLSHSEIRIVKEVGKRPVYLIENTGGSARTTWPCVEAPLS
jgi:hypothetical protein